MKTALESEDQSKVSGASKAYRSALDTLIEKLDSGLALSVKKAHTRRSLVPSEEYYHPTAGSAGSIEGQAVRAGTVQISNRAVARGEGVELPHAAQENKK